MMLRCSLNHCQCSSVLGGHILHYFMYVDMYVFIYLFTLIYKKIKCIQAQCYVLMIRDTEWPTSPPENCLRFQFQAAEGKQTIGNGPWPVLIVKLNTRVL